MFYRRLMSWLSRVLTLITLAYIIILIFITVIHFSTPIQHSEFPHVPSILFPWTWFTAYRYLGRPSSNSAVLPDPSRFIRLCKMINPDTEDPSSPNTETGFEISIFNLKNAPPYRALSYTFGPAEGIAEDNETMFYYDDWNGTILEHGLPRNLMRAINEIRKRRYTDWYWIESICIDQSNPNERNKQTNLKARIFQQADGVDVWLGQNNQDTPRLLNILNELSNREHETGSTRNFNVSYDGVSEKKYGYIAGLWSDDIRILSEFFSRRWFHRLWSFQDITLAENMRIMCGSHDIDYEVLKRSAYYLYDRGLPMNLSYGKKDVAGAMIVRQSMVRQVVQQPQLVRNLYSDRVSGDDKKTKNPFADYGSIMVWLYLQSIASFADDPRDYVYGLIGTANLLTTSMQRDQYWTIFSDWGRKSRIKADYSLPVAEVYQTFIKTIIASGVGIQAIALSQPSVHSNNQLRLPSWIPNLADRDRACSSRMNYKDDVPFPISTHKKISSGKTTSNLNQRFTISGNDLHLFGTRVGVVRVQPQPIPQDDTDSTKCLQFGLHLIRVLRDIIQLKSSAHQPCINITTTNSPIQTLINTLSTPLIKSTPHLHQASLTQSHLLTFLTQTTLSILWSQSRTLNTSPCEALSSKVSPGVITTILSHVRSIVDFHDIQNTFLERELVQWCSTESLFNFRSGEYVGRDVWGGLTESCGRVLDGVHPHIRGMGLGTVELDDYGQAGDKRQIKSQRMMALGSEGLQRNDEIWDIQGLGIVALRGVDNPVSPPSSLANYQKVPRVYQYLGLVHIHGITHGDSEFHGDDHENNHWNTMMMMMMMMMREGENIVEIILR